MTYGGNHEDCSPFLEDQAPGPKHVCWQNTRRNGNLSINWRWTDLRERGPLTTSRPYSLQRKYYLVSGGWDGASQRCFNLQTLIALYRKTMFQVKFFFFVTGDIILFWEDLWVLDIFLWLQKVAPKASLLNGVRRNNEVQMLGLDSSLCFE